MVAAFLNIITPLTNITNVSAIVIKTVAMSHAPHNVALTGHAMGSKDMPFNLDI